MSSEDFRVTENSHRTPEFAKSTDTEAFLERLNNVVGKSSWGQPASVPMPTLFVFGLPRSGTTLASQIAVHGLHVGYIDNVAARFWKAPAAGLQLSQSLMSQRVLEPFESTYGKSVDPYGPHEFAYFWHKWLRLESEHDMRPDKARADSVNWLGLRNEIEVMKGCLEKPFLFKTVFTANFIEPFYANLVMPMFVYVRRDPADVALSLLRARLDYYGDAKRWWSLPTVDVDSLSEAPPSEQIIQQVVQLSRHFEEASNSVPRANVVEVSYESMCQHPEAFLRRISKSVEEVHGYHMKHRSLPVSHFELRSQRNTDFGAAQELADELIAFFG